MTRRSSPSSPLVTPRIASAIRKAVGARYRLREVAGDASTRRFFRARGSKGSVIVMFHPPPFGDLAPFHSNHRILEAIGAPVPPLIAEDDRSGVVIVGDLGNVTLQRHLQRMRDPRAARSRRRLYLEACDLIILMQGQAGRSLKKGDFAAKNTLDRERFLSELDHFHRHFIGGLRRLTPSPGDEDLLRRFYEDIACECAALPRAYCHRDFQSRNLMVRRGRLHLIDFQDARMGPYTYDAASLLRDSSLDVDDDLVNEMTGYLARGLDRGPEEFRNDFDLVALQRNIKDLGTFAAMATTRGLASYLEYIPRTLRSIRNTLIRSRRYDPLFSCLEEFVLTYGRRSSGAVKRA